MTPGSRATRRRGNWNSCTFVFCDARLPFRGIDFVFQYAKGRKTLRKRSAAVAAFSRRERRTPRRVRSCAPTPAGQNPRSEENWQLPRLRPRIRDDARRSYRIPSNCEGAVFAAPSSPAPGCCRALPDLLAPENAAVPETFSAPYSLVVVEPKPHILAAFFFLASSGPENAAVGLQRLNLTSCPNR